MIIQVVNTAFSSNYGGCVNSRKASWHKPNLSDQLNFCGNGFFLTRATGVFGYNIPQSSVPVRIIVYERMVIGCWSRGTRIPLGEKAYIVTPCNRPIYDDLE